MNCAMQLMVMVWRGCKTGVFMRQL